MTRAREAALPVAIAASIAIHVSTFAVLLGLDAGPRVAPRATADRAPIMIETRLASLARDVAPTPVEPPPADTLKASAHTAIAQAEPLPEPTTAVPAKVAPITDAHTPVGWGPRIVINQRPPRARFGTAFDSDELAGFPIEVDAAVVAPDQMDIPYPPSALAARKEGTVLAWAVIDEQGAVEATHMVEGDPEFADAVESVLAKIRFIPAHDLGKTLRYYITLEIEFRIEPTGAVADVGAPMSPR